MKKYKIRIELQSDLCVSDGGVYNSALDIDICHDEYGFPYIPAKRLKGCLRECGMELRDWGMEIPLNKVFGDNSGSKAAVRIGDAYLENYSQMKKAAVENQNTLVFHPQNVLNHFSYIRTQTSINYETGVADEGSLRTMRVVNKGLVFEAEVELLKEYKEYVENCCKALNYMGVSRTRGLGEVKVVLIDEKPDANEANNENGKNKEKEEKKEKVPVPKDANYLEYVIELEEPVICKSVNGGEARTLDYLEGSKILGLVAQGLKRRNIDFLEFVNEKNAKQDACEESDENARQDAYEGVDEGTKQKKQEELFCSNAYIEHEGKRCVEVPATVYSIKNNSSQYVNKLYTEKDSDRKALENKQLNMMKHCYIQIKPDGELIKKDVEVEERYHHRRPKNKAIGRAIEVEDVEYAAEEELGDSKFYQIASICNGQRFRGYITGTYDQIQKIAEILEEDENFYMGYSKASEYGKVKLEVTKVNKKENTTLTSCKDFAIKLESPTIIYNNNAFYSTNADDLIEEINALLGIECPGEKVEKFVNYTTVGGFNVTWRMRKPTIEAFDKGTVLIYHLDKPVDITIPTGYYMGERITEGFGEISVTKIDNQSGKYISSIVKEDDVQIKTVNAAECGEFCKALCGDLFQDYVRISAVKEAKSMKIDEDYRSTVSNMIQMCKESDSIEKVRKSVEERYDNKKSEKKKDKMKAAKNILAVVDGKKVRLIDDFKDLYAISKFSYDKDSYECLYLINFLTELKYRLRPKEGKKGETENEQ